MYQVIKMYGDNEPWWFFEGWRDDIQTEKEFEDFDSAEVYFEKLWQELNQEYPKKNIKENYLSAFWDPTDERWCEECDEDLQQYHGLALLKDYQPIEKNCKKEICETTNDSGKIKCCKKAKA